MIFDDGVSSFGVYGYLNGKVYIMDAHKVTNKFMFYKTDKELDNPDCPPLESRFAAIPKAALDGNEAQFLTVPIEDFNGRYFRILSVDKNEQYATIDYVEGDDIIIDMDPK